MTRTLEKSLNQGDVFSIPIDDTKVGYGQIIVAGENEHLVVIFKDAYRKTDVPKIDKIINSEKLLMGITLDAKFRHEDWVIVGNVTSNLSEIKLPVYKLGLPGRFKIVDFFGNEMPGHVTDEIGDKLEYRTTRAPVGFEKALQASHGVGDWDSKDDKYLYQNFYATYRDIADIVYGEKTDTHSHTKAGTGETQFSSWIKIEFMYGKKDLGDLYSLQTELESLVDTSGFGEVDGNEIATDKSEGAYFIVCTQASDVLPLIQDKLKTTDLVDVVSVKKRDSNEQFYSSVTL